MDSTNHRGEVRGEDQPDFTFRRVRQALPDFGPVPIDPKEHVDIVDSLPITAAEKQDILWRNADRVFGLKLAGAGPS